MRGVAQHPAGTRNVALIEFSHPGTISESGYVRPVAGSPWYPAHTQRELPETASHPTCEGRQWCTMAPTDMILINEFRQLRGEWGIAIKPRLREIDPKVEQCQVGQATSTGARTGTRGRCREHSRCSEDRMYLDGYYC